jgi:hypothetical protein
MMGVRRTGRRALHRIGTELRREDPLLAAMLSENSDAPAPEQHPENGRARRRQARKADRRGTPYVPFVMF